jgi:hypothetical protein
LVYLLGGVSPGVAWYMGHWLTQNEGIKSHLQNVSPDVLKKSWVLMRANSKDWEKIEHVWPVGSGVSMPLKVEKKYFWPWGDGEGAPMEVFLYHPAVMPR